MDVFTADLSGRPREFVAVATLNRGDSVPKVVAQMNLGKAFMATEGKAKKIKRIENLIDFLGKATGSVKIGRLIH